MSFPALLEAEGRLKAKQDDLGKIFAEAGETIDFAKVTSFKGTSREVAAHVRKLNDECADIAKEVEDLQAVQKAADRARTAPDTRTESGAEPGSRPTGTAQQKSLGQLFTESQAFKGKSGASGPESSLDIELKTLFQTTDGWAPENTRTGRVVDFATRPIQVTDILPQTTTGQAAVTYMEETTFTNAAAEVDEGGEYQEAALELTEKSSVVRKIGVFLPITDEQLADEPQARGYVDNRLPFMVRQKLDSQILVGSGAGTPTQLLGILNVVGIQTQAKGADPSPDAVYKAMVKVRVTGRALPNAVIMNPLDWQDIRLLRTADGIYIWGNPSDAGPERIWGLNVVQADALTENTGVVGDFANFSELAVRRGIDVQVSNSHSDYFVKGKQAMRADIRCTVIWYRPTAFCTVTGI